MLAKFAVTNYRGFAERIEWDLSHPSNYAFNDFAIKDGVIKNGIIYGPNGSGKTNLGMALFDIVNHLTQKFKKVDYYRNFAYAGRPDEPVSFEYEFRLGGRTLRYDYAKSKDGKLMEEALSVDGREVFDRRGKDLRIDEEAYPMESAFKASIVESANQVSVINVLLTSYPLGPDHYLIKLRDFVDGMLWFRNLDIREFIGLETGIYVLDEYIIKEDLVEDFSDFLKKMSGQEFKFADDASDDKALACEYDGHSVRFDGIASTGTRSLMLLYFWLQKMRDATLVFIDEFDAFYHLELSYEVCKRLFALDCQAFTTSHNTSLMTNDLLRPDCYFILDGNAVKPLCACTDKELRYAHNLEKLYRGKAFVA